LRTSDLRRYIRETKGELLERLIEDKTLGTTITMLFSQNHRFYESFNRIIEHAVVAGVIDQFEDNFKDLITKENSLNSKLKEAEAMKVEHLEAAFIVWLVSLIFPITAFFGEWIVRVKDFIIFKSVFETFNEAEDKKRRNRDRKLQKVLSEIKNTTLNHTAVMIEIQIDRDLIDSVFGETIEIENTIESLYDELKCFVFLYEHSCETRV
jgi:hypothetical protein